MSAKIESRHLWSLTKRYKVIREPQFKCVFLVQDEILSALRDFLRGEGFIEILAPIIGQLPILELEAQNKFLLTIMVFDLRL